MPESTHQAELVVIGAGPGGYAAAFLAADLGMQVTLIDKEVNPGGVCLYRGCIPSKALLHAAALIDEMKDAASYGITVKDYSVDIEKLRDWKNKIVGNLTGGLGGLAKRRKIKYIQGRAEFTDSSHLKIETTAGAEETLRFENAILAAGSRVATLGDLLPDSPRVIDSTGALDLENVPETMLVIGGGYIGLELTTVYAELGSKVTVVEVLDGLLPGCDRDLVRILQKRLEPKCHAIYTSTKVVSVEDTGEAVRVCFEGKGIKDLCADYEKVLVSVGRKPNSSGIGLSNTKVKVNDWGFVEVDNQCRTADPHIFAIGDIVGQPMLAHKASHEGRVAVEAIAGGKAVFEPKAIPAVVFTDPEIAWAGLSETDAKKEGREVKVARFPWQASGRAMTLNRTDGTTKLIIDPETERILGVAIVGPGAGDMIAEGVLAIEMGATAADLKLTIHPHPTLSETVMEAAEVFFGHSTHYYTPKR